MTINEILIVSAIILMVVDIFFTSDFPTHLAYVIVTVVIAKGIDAPVLYQILFGVFNMVCSCYFPLYGLEKNY